VIVMMDRTVVALLEELDAAIARRRELPEEARAELAGHVAGLRGALERQREAESEERHRFGHDLRAHLNAIAGWTHVLRLPSSTPTTIGRAAEVFDRNVRTLTGLIEAYTTARDR
jgi:hypothetical protein